MVVSEGEKIGKRTGKKMGETDSGETLYTIAMRRTEFDAHSLPSPTRISHPSTQVGPHAKYSGSSFSYSRDGSLVDMQMSRLAR